MSVRERCRVGAAIVLAILAIGCSADPNNRPGVAYSHDGVLYITTDAGKVIQAVESRLPIVDFATSAYAARVVFVPKKGRAHGGTLHLLHLRTGYLERLSVGPYWAVYPQEFPVEEREAVHEVYSGPDISPDDRHVVFAIHGEAEGDLVEGSGPLGTLDLESREVAVLESTLIVDGSSVAYANQPRWSPDGRMILANFESGAAVSDLEGNQLMSLDSQMSTDDAPYTTALGWLGSGCVAYDAGTDWQDPMQRPARVLNLSTGRSVLLSEIASTELDSNIVEISPHLLVCEDVQNQLQVVSIGDEFPPSHIPGDRSSTFARILSDQSSPTDLPGFCREQVKNIRLAESLSRH